MHIDLAVQSSDFPRGDALTKVDLFAYLVELTAEGLKPLSRWDQPLLAEQRLLLEDRGLTRGVLRRLPGSGGPIVVTVFGRDASLVRQHVNAFDGASLNQTPERLRMEGQHFGYPLCCVESYILHGYRPNGLSPEAQDLLLHWACRDCGPTQVLIPAYRRVYQSLLNGSTDHNGA
jgi:hypothetical protein